MYLDSAKYPFTSVLESGWLKIREELEKEAAQSLLRRVVNVLRQPPASPSPKC